MTDACIFSLSIKGEGKMIKRLIFRAFRPFRVFSWFSFQPCKAFPADLSETSSMISASVGWA
jgi:hypothetical protein